MLKNNRKSEGQAFVDLEPVKRDIKEGFTDSRKEVREISVENRKENRENFESLQNVVLERVSDNLNLQKEQLGNFSATQSLSMIELVFCLAHPAMFRRMVFSLAEQEGWSDFAPGYGYPARASNRGDLYIEELLGGVVNINQSINWLIHQIEIMAD